jgi:hypothetical protein
LWFTNAALNPYWLARALTACFSAAPLNRGEVCGMTNGSTGPGTNWERQLREVAARVEDELRQAATYINDEVVPDIRKNGSAALRAAASELQKLAEQIDERQAAAEAARAKKGQV